MRYRKVPKNIRTRVYEYYDYRYGRKLFDEQGILEDLSKGLREVMSLLMHAYKGVVLSLETLLSAHSR